jgi:hypothetical protein
MSRSNSFDRLTRDECLSAYGTTIQSTRLNLLVVTTNEIGSSRIPRINNTNLAFIGNFNATEGLEQYQDPLYWACTGFSHGDGSKRTPPCINRIEEIRNAPQLWTISNNDGSRWLVDYCLSERAKLKCQFHFSPVIVVTVLNFWKFKRLQISNLILQPGIYDGR